MRLSQDWRDYTLFNASMRSFRGVEDMCDHGTFPGRISQRALEDAGRFAVAVPEKWTRHAHFECIAAPDSNGVGGEWEKRCSRSDGSRSTLRARVLGSVAEELAMHELASGSDLLLRSAVDLQDAFDVLREHIQRETEERKVRLKDDLADFLTEQNAAFARMLGRRIAFLARQLGEPVLSSSYSTKRTLDVRAINRHDRKLRRIAGAEIDMLVCSNANSDLKTDGVCIVDIKCRDAHVSPCGGGKWNPKPQSQLLCYGLLAAGYDQLDDIGRPEALVAINPVLGEIEAISLADTLAYEDRMRRHADYMGMDDYAIQHALEVFSQASKIE